MAFKDGSSSVSWTGFRWTASGGKDAVLVLTVSPQDGERVPSSAVPLTVNVSNTGGTGSDLQFQISTDQTFATVNASPTLSAVPDGNATAIATGLPTNTTLYWRVRAAAAGTTGWGPWVGGQVVQNSAAGTPSTSAAPNQGTAASAFQPSGINFGSAPTVWIQQALSSAQVVSSISFGNRATNEMANYPSAWTVQGSNDGSTWTTLDTKSGQTVTDGMTKTFPFATPNTTPYTYYRMTITATSGGGSNWVTLKNLSFDLKTGTVSNQPLSFFIDINASRAFGYSMENTGANPNPLYAGDIQSVTENTGFQVILYSGNKEYVLSNAGFEITIKSPGVDYAYEGDVSTNPPTPHLWFLWRPRGFSGDEVWAYGQGFGNPQGQYGGQLKIDPGPDYTTADVFPPINEWYLQEVVDHAYDDQRVIYAGSDVAPPNVTQQVEVIRFVIPASIVPAAPTNHLVYVTTTVGTSAKVPWLMYPTIPVAAGIAEAGLGSYSYARLAALSTPSGDLEQRKMAFTLPPYMVVRGRAQRMPTLVASCATNATLGSWDTTEALADAVSVVLGADRRWLPDATTVQAHPEIGTGVSLWVPKVGTNAMAWRFDAASAPVIDPAYEIETRLGSLTVPAMVFGGSAWAQLTANLPANAAFTLAMVAVLGPQDGGRGYLLSTFTSGAPDVGATAASLQLTGNRLEYYTGGRLATADLQRAQRRPVIVLLSSAGGNAQLQVVDLQPSNAVFAHPPLSSANTRLWLGRADQTGTMMMPATMDVLDLAYWGRQLSAQEVQTVVTRLDGIYGVTG